MKTTDVTTIFTLLNKEMRKYSMPLAEDVFQKTKDPFKVLVATILSARTKDALTITLLPNIFKKINTLNDLNKISERALAKLLYPIGFYKNKAKFLKQLPLVMQEKFDGVIPQTIEELVQLPGVGRKTANLVLSVAFNKHAICVDTHVHRITNRLGYVKTKTPLETEFALRNKLPKRYWHPINYLLVTYGQHVCVPISPHCSVCKIKKYCKRVNVSTSR